MVPERSLQTVSATAFAPAAITNFFGIHYDAKGSASGATGGGYILSKGTTTKATLMKQGAGILSTRVNGDESYDARTTRRAVSLLVESAKPGFGTLYLDQSVQAPIGSGFGSSAASALSAVFAAAEALGIRKPKHDLALFAHRAEILEQTGLGTVSVIYDATGAGAITEPGEPGSAKFLNVKLPKGLKIVTAFLAPYDKKDALSSIKVSERIDRLGPAALNAFVSDPSIETLAEQGELFSKELGLETPEVKRLITAAKSSGARYCSQNMIGYSVHALAEGEAVSRVTRALGAASPGARVDVFDVGAVRAGVLSVSRRR